jgi:hypothetical protein
LAYTKRDAVAEAHKLGLGPSKAALDVHTKGDVVRMIAEARKTDTK